MSNRRERERDMKIMWVSVRVRERQRESVCVCVRKSPVALPLGFIKFFSRCPIEKGRESVCV